MRERALPSTGANLDCNSAESIDRFERVFIGNVIAGKKWKAVPKRLFLKKIADSRAFCGGVQPHLNHHFPARQDHVRKAAGKVFGQGQAKSFEFRTQTVMQGESAPFFLKKKPGL